MFVISDFPPSVIDQIVGVQDTSYVVIKLWLCGNLNLNDKLSNGLTCLNLECHPLGDCRFPRLVSQLTSLRHLHIGSQANLVETEYDWPEIMRSLPSTLESLSIASDDAEGCIWNWEHFEDMSYKRETTYTRGESHAIEFETLFPRLHTLKLQPSGDHVSADLIPALPASLTHLDAPIALHHGWDGEDDYFSLPALSKLPPNIVRLDGEISWKWWEAEAFEHMKDDFANAPPSLQTIEFASGLAWKRYYDDEDADTDCWLPKSLVEVDWSKEDCPPWTPTLARTMPSQLHTLLLRDIDLGSFDNTHTNWVAELPRSLTSLTVAPSIDPEPTDFARYGHFLPPNLTDLTLFNPDEDLSGMFGAISRLSKLTSLSLMNWIEPSEIANLPRTLETLELCVSSDIPQSGQERPSLLTSTLPPNLTSLDLSWDKTVAINIALTNFKSLHTVTLKHAASNRIPLAATRIFGQLPASLTTLNLCEIGILAPEEGKSLSDDLGLPNLTSLEVVYIYSVDFFKHLPRCLRTLDIGFIRQVSESPLLADGQLYKDLPPTLTRLRADFNLGRDFKSPSIPAQSLYHLPLLKHLYIGSTPKMPSSILRTLPRLLTHLQIDITDWNEDDLPYLPPQLHVCHLENITRKVVKCMSLRSLGCLDQEEVSRKVWKLAQSRVLQASQNQ